MGYGTDGCSLRDTDNRTSSNSFQYNLRMGKGYILPSVLHGPMKRTESCCLVTFLGIAERTGCLSGFRSASAQELSSQRS
jgi:hypothetical protein